jgi:hypothetical protein
MDALVLLMLMLMLMVTMECDTAMENSTFGDGLWGLL